MLGIDGMSSDKSAQEDGQIIFIVRILLWRKDIEKYLAIIDKQCRINTDIFTSRGSQPVGRVWDGKLISNRDPVQGLPCSFYDYSWYETESVSNRTSHADQSYVTHSRILLSKESGQNTDYLVRNNQVETALLTKTSTNLQTLCPVESSVH